MYRRHILAKFSQTNDLLSSFFLCPSILSAAISSAALRISG